MHAAKLSIILVAMMIMSSCAGPKDVSVRAIKSPLATGERPASFRVAEGNAQLALGNVGLALESYRKALRENPGDVDAMLGMAACYDRMGRFDLSRKNYEMALAVKPQQTETYSQFAESLELQGKAPEAARVKTEIAARGVAPETPLVVPGSVPVLPPPPVQQVQVALRPVQAEPVAVDRPKSGARLERLSMVEVALLTRNEPQWEARTVARTARSTTIQFVPKAPVRFTLLNAARVQGLAARTRAYLAGRGFSGGLIGDAPSTRRQSAILYSAADSRRAERIAAQFGFALERREGEAGRLTVLLGHDAARYEALRPNA